jgi:DsbC/DsbD-like thiol-disulfide interchange protein
MIGFLTAAGAVMLLAASARAQESSAARLGAIVKAQAYVSREPVAQGSAFEIAVVADIPPAYHMNAHKVSDEYLIPTTVTAELPKGITQVSISYPPGKLKKFGFSATPLNVYEGRAVIRVKLSASTQAPVGSLKIPLTLRYQACNETTCFPPAHGPVTATLKIAPAGSASRPVHPEFFGKGM